MEESYWSYLFIDPRKVCAEGCHISCRPPIMEERILLNLLMRLNLLPGIGSADFSSSFKKFSAFNLVLSPSNDAPFNEINVFSVPYVFPFVTSLLWRCRVLPKRLIALL